MMLCWSGYNLERENTWGNLRQEQRQSYLPQETLQGRLVIFLGNLVNNNISKVRVLGRARDHSEVTGNKNTTLLGDSDCDCSNSLVQALLKQMDGLESENGEDDRTGVDGGEAVAERDDEDVLDAVLLGAVVRTEADDGAEG